MIFTHKSIQTRPITCLTSTLFFLLTNNYPNKNKAQSQKSQKRQDNINKNNNHLRSKSKINLKISTNKIQKSKTTCKFINYPLKKKVIRILKKIKEIIMDPKEIPKKVISELNKKFQRDPKIFPNISTKLIQKAFIYLQQP